MIAKPCKELTAPLLKLVTEDRRPTEGRYGVNALNGAPRVEQLKRRHWDEIEYDPMERLWMVMGKLLHSQPEGRADVNALAEERIKVSIGGRDVVGVVDHYADETITDYKFVSTWASNDGVKPEWEAQLNCYAYLLRACGFPVTKLQIQAVYRDWSQKKADTDKGYPPRAEVMKVKLWDPAKVLDHLEKRVALHVANETKPDGELTPCTDAERWARPGKFALMKEGNKKAVKLYDTREEAATAMAGVQAGLHYIQERPTEYARCTRCEVKAWCNQVMEGKSLDEQLKAAGW